MQFSLRAIHFAAGLILLFVFPLTGAYLRFRVPHLMQESDRFRFAMRGNHIYILLFGLTHLMLGAYLRQVTPKWFSRFQLMGSALLILSAAIVVVAFFYEAKTGLERPYIFAAMVMALAGGLLHALSSFAQSRRQLE